MAQGQYYPGSELIESPVVFDSSVTLSGGMKAGVATSPPTVAAGAGAGTGAAISGKNGTDFAGTFIVTAAGTPAAGTLATVTFGNALTATPSAVLVSAADTTAGATTGLAAGAGTITNLGFSVLTPASTATHTYRVTYVVIK